MSSGTQLTREQLDQLLQASKEPSSRDALILPQLDAIYNTASTLVIQVRCGTENSEQICDDLIQALRVLRNACAAGEATCTTLLELGVVPLLADTIDAVGVGAAALNWTLPAVVSQLLANLSNGSEACAAAVWRHLFLTHFTTLAHIDSCPSQEATSLTILTCCQVVQGAVQAVVGPQGAPILTAMMHANATRFPSREECNHTLSLLLGYVVFKCDSLFPLLASLSSSGEEVVEISEINEGKCENIIESLKFVAAHSLLLQELAVEAQDAPLLLVERKNSKSISEDKEGDITVTVEEEESIIDGSMACLLALLRHLAARKNKDSSGEGTGGGGKNNLEDDVLAGEHQLLQNTLHLIRDIAARDDDGHGLTKSSTSTKSSSSPSSSSLTPSLVHSLLASGLVSTLLSMLKALGPIINPRRNEPLPQAAAETAPLLTEKAKFFISQQPYQGYRSDILAAIANLAHKRPRVQAAVSACGGVELVLSQCQVDETSPLAREWALWAVRNLCEGSEDARTAIQELKACAALDSEELQKAGVKVTLDESTGKLIVGKREEHDALP